MLGFRASRFAPSVVLHHHVLPLAETTFATLMKLVVIDGIVSEHILGWGNGVHKSADSDVLNSQERQDHETTRARKSRLQYG